jgi:hypothetical protein
MNNEPKSLEMLSCVFYDLPESGEALLEILADEMQDPVEDVITAIDQLQKMGAIDVAIGGLTVVVMRKDGSRLNYPNYSKTFHLYQ